MQLGFANSEGHLSASELPSVAKASGANPFGEMHGTNLVIYRPGDGRAASAERSVTRSPVTPNRFRRTAAAACHGAGWAWPIKRRTVASGSNDGPTAGAAGTEAPHARRLDEGPAGPVAALRALGWFTADHGFNLARAPDSSTGKSSPTQLLMFCRSPNDSFWKGMDWLVH